MEMSAKLTRQEVELLYWHRQAGKRNKPGRSRDTARAIERVLAAEIAPRKRGR